MSNIKEAIELLENFRARGRYAGNIFKVDQVLAKLSTEQPPAGKLTKELINTWNDYLSTSFAILNIPQKRELCSKVNGLIGKVCTRLDRLDRSEASRKDLLTALKCFPKKLDSQTYEQFYNCCMSWIRTHQEAVIAKEKEVKI